MSLVTPVPDKFGRAYLLTIDLSPGGQFGAQDQIISVQSPITVEFDITRNTLTSMNVASVRIYNLSRNFREQIKFNMADTSLGIYKALRLQAGYGPSGSQIGVANVPAAYEGSLISNLPIIFQGNITQAWSVREGVNFITCLECLDGGFASANSFTSLPIAGTPPVATVLKNVLGGLPFVNIGAIGNFPGNYPRGQSVFGPTCELLKRDFQNGGFFIDREKAYLLNENEYVNDGAPLTIDSSSGLLATPVREVTFLDFDIIFEPDAHPGRLVNLTSSTDDTFTGQKKIVAVKHRGMISPAVCGEVITHLRTTTPSATITGGPNLVPVAPFA